MIKEYSKSQLLRISNGQYRPKLIDMRQFCFHSTYVKPSTQTQDAWFVGTLKGVYCN